MIRNFIKRVGGLFPPKSPPAQSAPKDERGWNEDWAVGDLAECLSGDWIGAGAHKHPHKGDVLTVSELWEGELIGGKVLASGLCFEGFDDAFAWRCSGFRKLPPISEVILDAAARGKQDGKPLARPPREKIA